MFRKRIFAALGNTSIFMGPGRPEFDPRKGFRPFEEVLQESIPSNSMEYDEGVIGSFMSGRFLNQANLPGFLPFLIPSLKGKPCVGVEGACGTGAKAIAVGAKTLLSDLANSVFVIGFEMQNRVKPLYGADILAGASDYKKMRKEGHAHFFPGLFDARAAAYFDAYGKERTRQGFARWYQRAILNARKHPKSQEYYNKTENLLEAALKPPNPEIFLPHLTVTDCSKISDGAASISLFSEEGLKKHGIEDFIEIVAIGEAEGDITQYPENLLELTTTKEAIRKALAQAKLEVKELSLFELHDCFSISGLLSLEAFGLAKPGDAPDRVTDEMPVNVTGGLIGFGHPTGASGVRMLVDLQHHLKAGQYGALVSMGGDDKTVTCIIVYKN